jgi:hypothetical protein
MARLGSRARRRDGTLLAETLSSAGFTRQRTRSSEESCQRTQRQSQTGIRSLTRVLFLNSNRDALMAQRTLSADRVAKERLARAVAERVPMSVEVTAASFGGMMKVSRF